MPRQPFNTRWAQGVESEDNLNTFKDPGDVRISTGWEGGQDKDAPPAGHENYWHNRVDSALQGVERQGVMIWHPQAIYGLGAPCYASDGNYYESLDTGNVGHNPTSTSGFWRYVGPSFFSGFDPGDLKMVAHNKIPPAGWLKCNGAVILQASYPSLFSAIGTIWNTGGESNLQFRLPDYRGIFVRGFSDGSSVDSGRTFAARQMDEYRRHSHPLAADNGGNNTFSTLGVKNSLGGMGGGVLRSSTTNTDESGGSETRPINNTANYWIKY
ncbi:tail fiber protein [Pseudomonas veronii]|uniref:phage tail protein n=1 Tax=Pseudomonas veronii TaxID=76761 RepID=UPI0015A0165E|nr:tail fiber protein [Pseudomonas veronii]NWD58232.1 tail fiber protein [Pseudomonas veronii]